MRSWSHRATTSDTMHWTQTDPRESGGPGQSNRPLQSLFDLFSALETRASHHAETSRVVSTPVLQSFSSRYQRGTRSRCRCPSFPRCLIRPDSMMEKMLLTLSPSRYP